jgi:hypothetical protein
VSWAFIQIRETGTPTTFSPLFCFTAKMGQETF